jgi:hypothetical protein
MHKNHLITAALFGLLAVPALAQNSPLKLTASTLLVTEVKEDGQTVEKLTDTANRGVTPGSLLQLQQRAENVSTSTVRGLKLSMAVPAATAFIGQQCNVPDVKALFSIDGKSFAAEPLKKFVTVTENGKDVKKEVTVNPSEYTHVRWQLPDLKVGQSAVCFIRTRVK